MNSIHFWCVLPDKNMGRNVCPPAMRLVDCLIPPIISIGLCVMCLCFSEILIIEERLRIV